MSNILDMEICAWCVIKSRQSWLSSHWCNVRGRGWDSRWASRILMCWIMVEIHGQKSQLTVFEQLQMCCWINFATTWPWNSSTTALFSWAFCDVAWLVDRFALEANVTAYELVRGHSYRGKLCHFGVSLMCFAGDTTKEKGDAKRRKGIFLCYKRHVSGALRREFETHTLCEVYIQWLEGAFGSISIFGGSTMATGRNFGKSNWSNRWTQICTWGCSHRGRSWWWCRFWSWGVSGGTHSYSTRYETPSNVCFSGCRSWNISRVRCSSTWYIWCSNGRRSTSWCDGWQHEEAVAAPSSKRQRLTLMRVGGETLCQMDLEPQELSEEAAGNDFSDDFWNDEIWNNKNYDDNDDYAGTSLTSSVWRPDSEAQADICGERLAAIDMEADKIEIERLQQMGVITTVEKYMGELDTPLSAKMVRTWRKKQRDEKDANGQVVSTTAWLRRSRLVGRDFNFLDYREQSCKQFSRGQVTSLHGCYDCYDARRRSCNTGRFWCIFTSATAYAPKILWMEVSTSLWNVCRGNVMLQNCGMLSLSKGCVHMWISLYVQSSPAFWDVEIKELYFFMWMTFWSLEKKSGYLVCWYQACRRSSSSLICWWEGALGACLNSWTGCMLLKQIVSR